ncbi:hypothetical protein N7519_009243 [Penicillium mononematosum]|uniref:uncharacterized protein n=1 Tax=Penicillium mononematosum TaxID=268346 RepID=UPI002546F216|nr:uncharacterized protein N7519_009243 [Penicillium mononematosum]KAJ6178782.1 hypothetical protein N7519_009243 [Penicillium mononematosum]
METFGDNPTYRQWHSYYFHVRHWLRLSSHPRLTVYTEWSDSPTAPPEAQNKVNEPPVESILETPVGPANAPVVALSLKLLLDLLLIGTSMTVTSQ